MSTPIGPYSPILRAGDLVVTSGQLGLHDKSDGTRGLVDGGTAAQLAQALRNVASVLATEDVRLDQVVKATLFLTDMADFAAANEVWTAAFGEHRPTRSAVAVAALPMGATAEVEVWAYAPRSS
jgi:2-iminobutanoate/2-iminopropanoate deaminase